MHLIVDDATATNRSPSARAPLYYAVGAAVFTLPSCSLSEVEANKHAAGNPLGKHGTFCSLRVIGLGKNNFGPLGICHWH